MYPQPTPQAPPPLRARVPTAQPRWTYVFIGINVVIFALMTFTGGTENSRNLIRWGANYAPLVDNGEFWRLFTANFIHIGFLHVAVNMYSLYVLGTDVEALYGPRRFVALYLLTGLSGSLMSYVFTHGLSAGASTSLFGLFGALGVYFYKHRELFGSVSQQRLTSLGVTLVLNVIIALQPGSNIDNWGHIGGLIGGIVLGWFFCPRYEPRDPFQSAFSPAVQRGPAKPELANETIVDTNSLAQNGLVMIAYVIAIIALAFARQTLS